MKQNNFSKKLFMTLVMVVTFAFFMNAKVIYVDCNATGNNDGTSWEDAFTDLQDGLDDASSGDEIRVADGTYKPTGTSDRTKTFQLKNGVAIYGGYAGCSNPDAKRNIDVYVTILSGNIGNPGESSDNCYHVVTGSGTDSTAVLDGFTITKGNANGTLYERYGGGMYNSSGSPTVKYCNFTFNNASYYGGGMFNGGSSSTIINCTFSCNNASYHGGGMYNISGSPALSNCTFSGNTASSYGGGMYNIGSSPVVSNCIFSSNSAQYGGGIAKYGGGTITLKNCSIYGNTASVNGGSFFGASNSDNAIFINCVLYNNTAAKGGAFYTNSYLTITNCTTHQNSAGYGGAIYSNSAGTNITVCNSILWDDAASMGGPEICREAGTMTVTYSCVKGGYPGTGNIEAAPEFSDPEGEDNELGTMDDNLRLRAGSPCIDAGNNSCYTGEQVDRDGNPRFIDDYGSPDTGNGTAPLIDMGAYEYQHPLRTHFLETDYRGLLGIGTTPKATVHIGSDRGLTISDTPDKILSWNAYYDNGWKYLDSDSAFQIASDYDADKWYFKTAAPGTEGNTVNWIDSLTLKSDTFVGIYNDNPKERLQIGGDKGATFHDGGDKALSWNAYFDNGWKYLGDDFAAQFYMDYINNKFYLSAAPTGQANGTVNWFNIFTIQADGKLGIGTANPKEMVQIGSGKGLTVHADTDLALSWNAYYDSGWKYLGSDYAYQLYAGSTADKLTVRTAASGTADNAITWIDCLTYQADGSVAIGTTDSQGYKLAVAGDMIAETLVVKPQEEWPDKMFQPNHQLTSIVEVEKYICENKHLPGIPTAEEVAQKGINVGEIQVKMLQKIEELTLYVIELKKENKALEKRVTDLEKGDNK